LKKVVLVCDTRGWAFDNIARQIRKHCKGYDFKTLYMDDLGSNLVAWGEISKSFHAAIYLWWGAFPALKPFETAGLRNIVCFYEHESVENMNAVECCEALGADAMMFSSLLLLSLAPKTDSSCPRFLCEDGVDIEHFRPMLPLSKSGPLRIGWCGNSQSDPKNAFARIGSDRTPEEKDHKGLMLIREACNQINREFGKDTVVLDVRDRAEGTAVPYEDLPAWYNQQDVIVCMSKSEGTPNCCLEAMACGRVFVSVPVGIVPEIGDYFIDVVPERSAKSLVEVLKDLVNDQQLSRIGREEMHTYHSLMRNDWSWNLKSKQFTTALDAVFEANPLAETEEAPYRVRVPGAKPRILLLADVRGWAFDQNLSDLRRYLQDDFDFTIDYVAEIEREHRIPDWNAYDLVYVAYHRFSVHPLIPERKRVGCLRSRWMFAETRRAADAEREAIQSYVAFHTTCETCYRELEPLADGVVFRNLTNPVAMDRFPAVTQVEDVVPMWCGNAQHFSGADATDVKGFYSIFRPVVRKMGLLAEVAEYNTCRRRPEEMPEFYLRGSVYVAPSLYEGASNAIMEAMACGHVVIVTDTGNHRDMREYALRNLGSTGIIIVAERTQAAFREALVAVAAMPLAARRELGRVNRKTIEQGFSWEAWKSRYREFFKTALEVSDHD
jgi:glycosyltransferase involved in cell wall biosynthesis